MSDPAHGDETRLSGPDDLLPRGSSDSGVTAPFGGAHRLVVNPPTQVGPYYILEPIGEGGMGSVYLAERREPVHLRVALKVIKPGMDTREIISRFEGERRALAMMNHPGIARVLDAGATPDGRPYFVMEYVAGVPITQYCDTNRSTNAERLNLFVHACMAVQHAHDKGVIHRDIKPSNVLVTMQDGKPVPKVIDFGVAKATQQLRTERTVFTHHGQLIGTLEYMSPEQAEMSGLEVDTRTDVYSLGVVLYELLVGVLPFDNKTLRQAGPTEIHRIIREVDPPKPSTRLSTMGEKRTDIANRRRLDLRALQRELSGELDWIVLKAMEKDRTRRYESAAALAADIERYLNEQPIEARPPSAIYRARKLLRRRRIGISLAALGVVAVLTTGIAVANRRSASRTASESALQRSADLAQQAGLFIRAGDLSAAEDALREALLLDPDNINALLNRATIRRQQWEETRNPATADEAMACLDRVIQLRPKRYETFNIKGVFLRNLGRIDEAIEQHRIAAGIEPDYAPNWVSLANAWVLKGDFDQTEQCLKTAASKPPTPGDNRPWQRWHNLAALQLARDDPGATTALERAIELGAKEPDVWLLRAKACLLLKAAYDPRQAVNAATTAENLLRPAPASAHVKRVAALALLRAGDNSGALATADRAADLKDSPLVYSKLISAIALARLSRSDEAKARLAEAQSAWSAQFEKVNAGISGNVENGLLWFETIRELQALKSEAEQQIPTSRSEPGTR